MCKRLSSQPLTFVSYAQVGRLNCIRTRDARGYESNVRITRGTETWDNFGKNGNKVFDASYDAWGRQTVTLNTIGLHRGYTGHEMLTEFDIINMNGRLYDPVLGRFLSPDNYVQLPDNSQSFNRYSYCLNNPLKYTDPSGELFGIDDAVIAFALFNMAGSMMQASFHGENVWKAGALSLLSSAASYGIGAAFGATGNFGHELLRAGAHGLAGGVINALEGGNIFSGFISSAAASGIGSFAQGVRMNTGLMLGSTTLMGGVVAWATGGKFLEGAMRGLMIGALNHAWHNRDVPHYRILPDGSAELDEVVVIGDRDYGYHHSLGYYLFGDTRNPDGGYGPIQADAVSFGIGITLTFLGETIGIEGGILMTGGRVSPYFTLSGGFSLDNLSTFLTHKGNMNPLSLVSANAYGNFLMYSNTSHLKSFAPYTGLGVSNSVNVANIGLLNGYSAAEQTNLGIYDTHQAVSYGASLSVNPVRADFSKIKTKTYVPF